MLFPARTDPNYKNQVEELKKNPSQWGHHIDSSGKNYHPDDWKEVPLVVASTDEAGMAAAMGILDAETAPERPSKKAKG